MKYKYVIFMLYILGTLIVYSKESELGNILQQAGKKKAIIKTQPIQKKKIQKKSRFVFKDEYKSYGMGSKEKSTTKKKSQNYEYKNKSRFKFKFNDGYAQSNLVGEYQNGGAGMNRSIDGSHGSRKGGRR